LKLAGGLGVLLLVGAVSYRTQGPYGPVSVHDVRAHRVFDSATGTLSQIVYDASGDHKPDSRAYYQAGRVVRLEVDSDQDGKADTWYYYGLNEQVEKIGFSRRHDGVVDAWRILGRNGQVVSIEFSDARDGTINRRELVGQRATTPAEPSISSAETPTRGAINGSR